MQSNPMAMRHAQEVSDTPRQWLSSFKLEGLSSGCSRRPSDPQRRTHRPSGCEWLSTHAFFRCTSRWPVGKGPSLSFLLGSLLDCMGSSSPACPGAYVVMADCCFSAQESPTATSLDLAPRPCLRCLSFRLCGPSGYNYSVPAHGSLHEPLSGQGTFAR